MMLFNNMKLITYNYKKKLKLTNAISANISRRFMMSSSGSGAVGKGPKLPPSFSGSSESKLPHTPYKTEDLQKAPKAP